MTPAKLRLAPAAMGPPETKVGDHCGELGVTRQTLYQSVSPTDELRTDGRRPFDRGRRELIQSLLVGNRSPERADPTRPFSPSAFRQADKYEPIEAGWDLKDRLGARWKGSGRLPFRALSTLNERTPRFRLGSARIERRCHQRRRGGDTSAKALNSGANLGSRARRYPSQVAHRIVNDQSRVPERALCPD